MVEIDVNHLQTWVGRKQQSEDIFVPGPAAGLAATLDREQLPTRGDPLPPLWHWVYFTPRARQSELGRDGHPKLGGFMPPVPLPRRMWAGGRLRFPGQIRFGDTVSKETEILRVAHKVGRQGSLVFLTLRHSLYTAKGLMIEEEQDLVYREPTSLAAGAASTDVSSAERPQAVLWREAVVPTSTLLFRYSALTFNTHRIHYDLPYAREEEGYPALVVHGPLIATLLADALGRNLPGRLVEFAFRGESPLFADQPFNLCGRRDGDKLPVWAEAPDGRVAMSATARLDG